MVKFKHGHLAYIDQLGQIQLDENYDVATRFHDGAAIIANDQGTYVIDKSGKHLFDATGITRTASVFPIAGLRVDVANGIGSFSRERVAGLHGFMPLGGVAKVCLFAACDQSPLANLSLPLSVIGRGGSVTLSASVSQRGGVAPPSPPGRHRTVTRKLQPPSLTL